LVQQLFNTQSKLLLSKVFKALAEEDSGTRHSTSWNC